MKWLLFLGVLLLFNPAAFGQDWVYVGEVTHQTEANEPSYTLNILVDKFYPSVFKVTDAKNSKLLFFITVMGPAAFLEDPGRPDPEHPRGRQATCYWDPPDWECEESCCAGIIRLQPPGGRAKALTFCTEYYEKNRK